MSRQIHIIAKHHQPVPIDLLAKVLIAQARAQRRRRQAAERERRLTGPKDAA